MLARWKNFDWILLGCLLTLALGGSLSLASASTNFFWRQFVWYLIAFVIILIGSQFDWKWLGGQALFRQGFYWISVVFLVLSNLQSQTIRGTKSWLVIGGVQFEPVELAKLALIFVLANFFSRRHISAWRSKNILSSFVYTLIPAGLVVIHPDFGSAIVLLSIWVGFLLISGIHKKRLAIGIVVSILLMIVAWNFLLKPYQKDRFTSFLFPERDPFGTSYNVIQSKIAIGSAGLFGKGFGMGTQSHLNFLPEAHTDFIFAAFIEEWGFVGGSIIVLVFFLFLYRIIRIGLCAIDNYSKFIALGATLMFSVHFFINVGSNLGLLPVTGITLPFFSYGGSSLLTVAIVVSIIERIKTDSC